MNRRRDEFDDQDSFIDSVLQRSRSSELPPSLKKTAVILGVAAAVGVLGGVVWTTYFNPGSSGSDVPIIRAESKPYKVEPENPGGMAVQNKDSTVFETLRGENQAQVENLLDDSEKPVEKEDYFAEREKAVEDAKDENIASPSDIPPSADEKPTQITENQSKKLAEEIAGKMDTTPKSLVAVNIPESEPTPADAPAKAEEPVKEEPAQKAEAKKAAAQEPAAADAKAEAVQPTAGGAYYVQLASVKSEADAKTQWPKMQTKNPELSNLTLRVQQADLGAKGTYYRIQGGPLTQAQAKEVCSAINARQAGGCLVAKPQ